MSILISWALIAALWLLVTSALWYVLPAFAAWVDRRVRARRQSRIFQELRRPMSHERRNR